MIIDKTIQERKARLNVESMLSFNGVDQYATAGVNQNINAATDYNNSFSIGFFVFVNTLEDQFISGAYVDNAGFSVSLKYRNGVLRPRIFMRRLGKNGNKDQEGDVSLKVGQLYHIIVNYNNTTQIPDFYVNGVSTNRIVVTDITVNSTLFSSSHDFRIGMNRNMNNNSYANAAVSHLTFFNRTLTEPEIRSIHRNGGLLPVSTHAHCVAHYPMTQREGQWLYDQVEQYNYAKAVALKPYHALLKNFTEEEHTGNQQTAWKDFYSKVQLNPYGLFPRSGGDFRSPSLISTVPENSDISFFWEGVFNSDGLVGSQTKSIFKFGGGLEADTLANNSIRIIRWNDLRTQQFNEGNNQIKLVYTYHAATTTGTLYYIRDGVIEEVSRNDMYFNYGGRAAGRSLRFGQQPNGVSGAFQTHFAFSLYRETLSSADAKAILKGEDISPIKYLNYNFSYPTQPNTIPDLTGNGFDLTRVNGPFLSLEKSSLLPPIKRGLRFDNNQQASIDGITPSLVQGYSCIVNFSMFSNSNWDIETLMRFNDSKGLYLDSPKRFFTGPNSIGVNEFDFTKVSQIVALMYPDRTEIYFNGIYKGNVEAYLEMSGTTGNIIIGNFPGSNSLNLSGFVYSAGVAQGILTLKQIHALWNNGLLANPSKSWSNLDWQMWLDFNQIIDDSGQYEIVNNGSAGGNAILSGYTASDLQDQATSKIRVLENTRLNKLYPSFYPKIYPQKS